MNKQILIAIGGVIVVVLVVLAVRSVNPPLGGASPNTAALVATSSSISVGPQEKIRIFTADTAGRCLGRSVSNLSAGLMLWFMDTASTSVGALVGHIQATTTNVYYDSSLYGCGAWTAYSHASSTITISEWR